MNSLASVIFLIGFSIKLLIKTKKKYLAVIFIALCGNCYSNALIIQDNIVIDSTRIYDGVKIDLSSRGRFTVTNHGHLTIRNSQINITISPKNQFFIHLIQGNITLENSTVRVFTKDIPANPYAAAKYHVINVEQGTLRIINNIFTTNSDYTVGLIATSNRYDTHHHVINHNKITNFHGGIYLLNAHHCIVNNNVLSHVSYNNIVTLGEDFTIRNNTIMFSGKFAVGDGMAIVDSTHVLIQDNKIYSGSCYGIQLINSNDITIHDNHIVDGITYAIYLSSSPSSDPLMNNYTKIHAHPIRNNKNSNITISNNYLAQNRYGIAGENIANLMINDNFFIQQFKNSTSRVFFTNNAILFKDTTNMHWVNNFYKEAYTQVNGPNKRISQQFVPYPATGGVLIKKKPHYAYQEKAHEFSGIQLYLPLQYQRYETYNPIVPLRATS